MPNVLDALPSGSPFEVLLPVAIILALAKILAIVFEKMKIPSVIGFLCAGLFVGLLTFIPGESVITPYTEMGIDILAKFGVVFILFSAGLETNMKEIKAVGGAAIVITALGVICPMLFGFLIAFLFRSYGGLSASFLPEGVDPIWSDLYYGVILSATSVSITVATLKELGKLNGKVGSAIVSAAIIDDVIGIILLSLVLSLSGTSSASSDFNLLIFTLESCGATIEGAWQVVCVLANMAIFVLLSFGAGYLIRKLFNWLGQKYPHHIRIPILSLAFCFLWAYIAQGLFQIADITGAYIAGLILAPTSPKEYIDHRAETTMNVFFVPIFFASVALKMYETSLDFSDYLFLAFGFTYVVAALLGKVVGAGSGALLCRFSLKDSLCVGVGMMARAEVVIVTAQTGIDSSLVSPGIMPFTLLIIISSSFLTPILLRLLYRNEKDIGGGDSAKKEEQNTSLTVHEEKKEDTLPSFSRRLKSLIPTSIC